MHEYRIPCVIKIAILSVLVGAFKTKRTNRVSGQRNSIGRKKGFIYEVIPLFHRVSLYDCGGQQIQNL